MPIITCAHSQKNGHGGHVGQASRPEFFFFVILPEGSLKLYKFTGHPDDGVELFCMPQGGPLEGFLFLAFVKDHPRLFTRANQQCYCIVPCRSLWG